MEKSDSQEEFALEPRRAPVRLPGLVRVGKMIGDNGKGTFGGCSAAGVFRAEKKVPDILSDHLQIFRKWIFWRNARESGNGRFTNLFLKHRPSLDATETYMSRFGFCAAKAGAVAMCGRVSGRLFSLPRPKGFMPRDCPKAWPGWRKAKV